MSNRIKVRVGQVWRVLDKDYLIYKIVGTMAQGRNLTTGHENPFGSLDADGYARWDTTTVLMVKDAAPATLMDFFLQVPGGHCACNIPVIQCKYHGGAKV